MFVNRLILSTLNRFSATTFVCGFIFLILITSPVVQSETSNRITILYDSFGNNPGMKTDWGFAAYIEFSGKRILFDTGNNAEILKQNSQAADIDLSTIDFAVISHWHDDHTSGLDYIRDINPNVPIYIPVDFSKENTDQNNFKITQLTEINEISQNIFIISALRNKPELSKLQELTLALQSSQGLILIAGCSHPGILQIVAAATKIDPQIVNIFGGFHLIRTPTKEIRTIASALKNEYKVQNIAPGHCTGETAVGEFSKLFQERLIYSGLGTVIELPQ